MNTQAQEQFISDFLLVSENDYDTHMEATYLVKTLGLVKAGEELQAQFENWVSFLAEKEDERGNGYGALLLKQLLIGWGSDSFYQIAKRFEEAVA